MLSIPLILSCLQELNKSSGSIYYGGIIVDYCFTFMDKCDQDKIAKFEKSIGYPLHEDYKQFLSITNGLHLSSSAVSHLPGIEAIADMRSVFDFYPPNFIVVGSFYDGDIHALMDLCTDANACMYIHETISPEPMQSLGCNFTEFLHRFVTSYGLNFWEWGALTLQL